MKNQYFRIVKCNNESYDILTCIHVKQDIDIWNEIYEKHLDTKEYSEIFHKDPYGAIYHYDIKHYLKNDFPNVYNLCKSLLTTNDIEDDIIKIWLASSEEYRKFDEQFDYDLKFIECMNSEISEFDKHKYITNDILVEAGFENITNQDIAEYWKTSECNILDYSEWKLNTTERDGDNFVSLVMEKGVTNNGALWNLHIDNNFYETIGSADISTVWQFNTLMQVFGSKFRL